MKSVRRPILLSRSTFAAWLAVAFGLVAGTALLSAFSTYNVASADQRAVEADRALNAASEMLVSLDEMEVAAQVYTSSADRNLLPPYEKSREFLALDFTELRRQLEERGPVSPVFRSLQAMVIAKIQEIDQGVQATTATAQPYLAATAERVAAARRSADIRELAHTLQREEFAEVADGSATAVARARSLQAVNLLLVAVAIALALAAAWFLFQGRRESDGLVTVCAWTHRVRWQGTWLSFEDFLTTRYNVMCTHGISDDALARMHGELKEELPAEALSR
jgi:CHASE3 domain sensor protein